MQIVKRIENCDARTTCKFLNLKMRSLFRSLMLHKFDFILIFCLNALTWREEAVRESAHCGSFAEDILLHLTDFALLEEFLHEIR